MNLNWNSILTIYRIFIQSQLFDYDLVEKHFFPAKYRLHHVHSYAIRRSCYFDGKFSAESRGCLFPRMPLLAPMAQHPRRRRSPPCVRRHIRSSTTQTNSRAHCVYRLTIYVSPARRRVPAFVVSNALPGPPPATPALGSPSGPLSLEYLCLRQSAETPCTLLK